MSSEKHTEGGDHNKATDNDSSSKEPVNSDGVEQERDADFSALEESDDRAGNSQGKGSGQTSELKAELAELKDKYLRSLAELENYKKRALKERSDLIKYQGEKVLSDMLEIGDNLDLALKHSEADPEKLKSGVALIHKMFMDTLSRWEVRSDSALGKEFDPNKHSALSKVPVDDAKPGTVINELKKAYFYKDKLLRPAHVVVADEKPKANQSEQAKVSEEEGEG